MVTLQSFFMFIAFCVPIVLIVWHVLSSIGRITRGIEEIAVTLRRIEQGGRGKPL